MSDEICEQVGLPGLTGKSKDVNNRVVYYENGQYHIEHERKPPTLSVIYLVDAEKPGKEGRHEKHAVAIPEFTSVIPAGEKSGGELLLAGAMTPPPRKFSALFEHVGRHKYIYIAAIVLLAAALWLIIRRFRRREQEKSIPCWEAALAAISALETQCRHGDILPAAGYTVLLDILRDYLELRFDLPVSRQTASEFAIEVTRSSSPLPPEFRLQLNLFFENSDLIRFAKAPADNRKLLDAANDLANFIRATIPDVENNSEEKQR